MTRALEIVTVVYGVWCAVPLPILLYRLNREQED